jgi:hypothetical protein
MGIAKQSLYDTYGDKRGLYMKALAYYRRQTNDGLRGLFGAGRPVKEVFAKLLFGLSAESKQQHERGCLLLSANLERDTSDASLAEFLWRGTAPRAESRRIIAKRGCRSPGAVLHCHNSGNESHGAIEVRSEKPRTSSACRFSGARPIDETVDFGCPCWTSSSDL